MKIKLKTPLAPKKPKTLTHHGETRTDNYYWLRDIKDKDTLPYLKAENKYFETHLKPLSNLKKKIASEMKARITENDESPLSPMDQWLYFWRWKKGLQYPIRLRKLKGSKKEQVILDINKKAKGKKYCDINRISPNHDHTIYGFASDYNGSEKYLIEFFNIDTQKPLNDQLTNTSGNYVFSSCGDFVFYTELDDSHRPYLVKRHQMGTAQSTDIVIFKETDPRFFVSVSKSSSGNYVFVTSQGKTTSEVWYLDAHNPTLDAKCFAPRVEDLDYNVDHAAHRFWIYTDHKAPNFKIMTAELTDTRIESWKDFIPHNTNTYISGMQLFKKFLVLSTKENGLPQIFVVNIETQKQKLVQFKEPAFHVMLTEDNYEYDTCKLRLRYSSPVTPSSTLEYDMNTHKVKTLKTKKIKGHNPKNYKCERVWVQSHDGTKVPMVITYRKSLKKPGKNPCYLYGYGSYGASIPDAFSEYRDIFRLLDRGYVHALAHIRGGSEMGRHWYEDGKYLKKKNTFLDFIACGEYLKNKGYSHPKGLTIAGGSAGGMLVGACVNMRPDLFDLVVAHVPFVDVLNTMQDATLPLTPTEFKEWGNPEDKAYYDYIKSYSPYDNVEAKNYPPFFVTCGLNDQRVTYWEPAKWVAKLRELKTDSNIILYKINMGAGHFGATGRYDHVDEMAEEYAFIVSHFNNLNSKTN